MPYSLPQIIVKTPRANQGNGTWSGLWKVKEMKYKMLLMSLNDAALPLEGMDDKVIL